MAIQRDKKRVALLKVVTPIVIILLVVIGALYTIKVQFSRNGPVEERAEIQTGKILPDLTFTRIGGDTLRLSEIKAKVYMVTFWATWCEACMVEMPSIVKLRNKYKDQGFEVLGINLDESPDLAAPKAAKQLGIEFPLFKDPDGKVAEFFDVRAIPLTIILDHQRKILHIRDGELDWSSRAIQSQLERWLSG